VAFYFEVSVSLHLAHEGVHHLFVLEIGDVAADTADQVVVVRLPAHHVGVAAPAVGVLVDPLQDAHPAQQLQRAKYGRSPYARPVHLHRFPQLGRSERRVPAHNLVQHHAPRLGGPVAFLLKSL
jgi:hypothetical protein